MILRRRGWWVALLLILLHAHVASQGDSATVHVVRVIDGDTMQVQEEQA
jgi:endonuclease YncB( thermonuclease family)